MAKSEQYDILGQPLEVGNYVAVSMRNEMFICRICKITPKMIRAKLVGTQQINRRLNSEDGGLIYSSNTVKISGEDATAVVLKYAK